MTDHQKQLALQALAEFRANLGNPYGFPYPAYITADVEPVATVRGWYVFQLTQANNGVSGFLLADAVYPLRDRYDLKRSIAIVRDWELIQRERRARNGRKKYGIKR